MYPHTIVIRVDGSVKIGLGHIFRMRDLASYLNKYGVKSIFIIQEDKISQELLESSNHTVFRFTEKIEILQIMNFISEKQNIQFVLNDTLETNSDDLTVLKTLKNFPIITFDDIGAGLKEANTVINSLVYSWNYYSKDLIMSKVFEGPKYLVIQDSIEKYSNLKRNFFEKSLSISIGGTDTHNVSIKLLIALEPLLDTTKINLILGPGASISKELKLINKKNLDNLFIHYAPNDLFKIVSQTSLLICAGGMTLFEAMAIGQPCAAIACEEHEINNINSQENYVVNLGFHKSLDFSQLKFKIQELLSSTEKLKKMNKRNKDQIDFNGKGRIFEILKYWLPM